MMRRAVQHRERGSSTLELVIVAVPTLMLLGLLIVGALIKMTAYEVQTAAFSAAREASLARNAGDARIAGEQSANVALNQAGITCAEQSIGIDLAAFNQPIGTTGEVRVTLSCRVDLSEAGLPGVPGSTEISEEAVSPVDPYRQR